MIEPIQIAAIVLGGVIVAAASILKDWCHVSHARGWGRAPLAYMQHGAALTFASYVILVLGCVVLWLGSRMWYGPAAGAGFFFMLSPIVSAPILYSLGFGSGE